MNAQTTDQTQSTSPDFSALTAQMRKTREDLTSGKSEQKEREAPSLASLEAQAEEQRKIMKALDETIIRGEREVSNKRDQRLMADEKLRMIEDQLFGAAEREVASLKARLLQAEERYFSLKPRIAVTTNEPVIKTVNTAPSRATEPTIPEIIPMNKTLEPMEIKTPEPEREAPVTPIRIRRSEPEAVVPSRTEIRDPIQEKIRALGREYYHSLNELPDMSNLN